MARSVSPGHVVWAYSEHIWDDAAEGLTATQIRTRLRDESSLHVGEHTVRAVLEAMPPDWKSRGTAPSPAPQELPAPTPDPALDRPTALDARQVLNALYARHPGSGGQMPGPWTCIEEWRNIDLLAFSAWQSQGKYARIGYEVKVSRSDLRHELLKPSKRAQNVQWCNEFYIAIPKGLLTPDELAWQEPEWQPEDWTGARCPGYHGIPCATLYRRGRERKTHYVDVPIPTTREGWHRQTESIVCPTCNGKGTAARSRVEQEAPTCWIPNDVGLILVDGRGTRLHRPAPKRKTVPQLTAGELGQLVRWISMRPDPRHAARRSRREHLADQLEQHG